MANHISRRTDLAGQRFGRRTVEVYAGPGRNGAGAYYWCLCDCGRRDRVHGGLLRRGEGIECVDCARKTTGLQNRQPKGESAKLRTLLAIKAAAKKRGYVWDLDDETFHALCQMSCQYCGVFQSNTAHGYVKGSDYHYNGIDRVNNKLGYTKENSVPCCGDCNRWKSDMTAEEFIEHVRRIAKHLETVLCLTNQ